MKIYSRAYNTNYAQIAKAHPPLVVPGGTKKCFAIPFPSEGFMERVVVYQVGAVGPQGPQGPQDGPLVDFEVELLNSKLPFQPGSYNPETEPIDALELYRIQVPPTAPLSASAGEVLSFSDDDYGQGYRNIDGGWTLNQRFIYVVIKPIDSAQDTTWNFFAQCRTDVG